MPDFPPYTRSCRRTGRKSGIHRNRDRQHQPRAWRCWLSWYACPILPIPPS